MKCLDCKEGLTVEVNPKVCKTCGGRSELPEYVEEAQIIEAPQEEPEEVVEEAVAKKSGILKKFWN